MSKYKDRNGKPTWKAHRGLKSSQDSNKLDNLVRKGLASRWAPLRDVDSALKAAGLV